MHGLGLGLNARGQRSRLNPEESIMCPSDDPSDGQNPDSGPVVPNREPPSGADPRRAASTQLVQERLLNDGVVLSPQSVAEILALGAAAVEPLVVVMADSVPRSRPSRGSRPAKDQSGPRSAAKA